MAAGNGNYTTQTWTWFEDNWLEGNPPIMGPRSHGLWLGSVVFDGARAFEGVTPDLDLHCERVVNSANVMGLNPHVPAGQILELVSEALAKFNKDAELYIRPMYWAEQGGFMEVPPMPDSTKFCLCVYEAPLPKPVGMTIGKTAQMRPTIAQAPVKAKAACLYPNSATALREVNARGFDNALVRDSLGNVAELATANVFLGKEGAVHTPVANGTFLNGITRQRVISILKQSGIDVFERSLQYEDFEQADEIFCTGNYSKVMPITKFEEHDFQPGPLYQRARELYWTWSHSGCDDV